MTRPEKRAFALLVTFSLVLVPSVPAGDWPQFRGPGGAGVADEPGLPVTWDVTKGTNVRWRVDLPGRGVSCPVVVKGRVYVTSCTGYRQDRLHVLGFDARTGKKLWERQFWATGSTNSHAKTSMAGPTPVAEGDRVFALFGTGDLAGLDSDGNLLWYRALVRDYPTITNQVGMAASPVLWKDTLLVPMDNAGDESFLAALDARTGTNRWKVERDRVINWATPLVLSRGNRAEVLFQSPRGLVAYDVDSGEKRWSFQPDSLADIASPTPANGLVLVTGREVFAVRPGEMPEVVWSNNRLRPAGFTTPVYYRQRVYSVSGGNFLNVAGAADGKVSGAPLRLKAKGSMGASPVAGDGKLYVIDEEGNVMVIRAGDQPQLLATNAMGEPVLATPAIADGALFLRTDTRLYCIAQKK